jgi:hypothetical protein
MNVPPYVKPARKTNWWPWVTGLSLLGVGGMGFLFIVVALASAFVPSVGVIELSGAITDEGSRGVLGGSTAGGARTFIEEVEQRDVMKALSPWYSR